MNPGHSYQLPSGEPIAAIVRQMWAEQLAAILQAIKLYGRQGLQAIDLARWQPALIQRIEPLYREWAIQGQENFLAHVQKPKHIKRGAGVQLVEGTMQRPAYGQVSEYIEAFDPMVAEFARTWAYDFAASTLATTQQSIYQVIKQTQHLMASGLEEGSTLDQLTQSLSMVFNDPQRAFMIAATESARAYNYGQLETAKESGEVSGKTWLASADACDACLALNGKTVPLDVPFVEEGGRYGTIMAPPRHPHCFCVLTYELSPTPQAETVANRVKPVGSGWQVFLGAA